MGVVVVPVVLAVVAGRVMGDRALVAWAVSVVWRGSHDQRIVAERAGRVGT